MPFDGRHSYLVMVGFKSRERREAACEIESLQMEVIRHKARSTELDRTLKDLVELVLRRYETRPLANTPEFKKARAMVESPPTGGTWG